MSTNKKVLLIVIDALSSHTFVPALEEGRLPNFKALVDSGQMDVTCSTIFPSITHAALSSLMTGTYPKQHGIPGGHWFDIANTNIVYYIGDFWTVWNEGIEDFVLDLLYRLNQEQVQQPTLFELVERAGLKACCINHIIHRGDVEHDVEAPLLMQILPGIREIESVFGPTLLFLGDFVHPQGETHGAFVPSAAGLSRRYGMDDTFSADVLIHLAQENALPDLTVAYFMDNDFESHKDGPQEALSVLESLDQRLGELFDVYGGLEAMLADFCVMVTGDHAQIDIAKTEGKAVIDLGQLLGDLKVAPLGQPWTDDENIVLCPNLRAMQLYLKQTEPELIAEISRRLLDDARIDQVMWRRSHIKLEARGYTIQTKDRGELHFWPVNEQNRQSVAQGYDLWGRLWQWQGDLNAIDAKLNTEGKLEFGTYPNAFERIVGALQNPHSGQIWATAHPGAEFRLESSMIHLDGGSHGSLHTDDSTVPLLVAGLPDTIQMPTATRSVDVAPLCLSILGIEPKIAPGKSHVGK